MFYKKEYKIEAYIVMQLMVKWKLQDRKIFTNVEISFQNCKLDHVYKFD